MTKIWRRMANAVMLSVAMSAGVFAGAPTAQAAAPPPWSGGCGYIFYTPAYPPTSAYTTCYANQPAWFLLTASCGSSGVYEFKQVSAWERVTLNVHCYDYATITNAYTSGGPRS